MNRNRLGSTFTVTFAKKRTRMTVFGATDNVFSTAWSMYVKQARIEWNAGKPPPPPPVPKNGLYLDADGVYVYSYNGATADTAIVISPSSIVTRPVTKGSNAWKAIIDAITTGRATPISAADVKARKVARTALPPVRGNTSAPAQPPAEVLPVDAGVTWQDKVRKYAPWLVGASVAVAGAFAFWPARKA